MSQTEKAFYYQGLKAAGVDLSEKHYREYSTDELRPAYERLVEEGMAPPFQAPAPEPQPQAQPEPPRPQPQSVQEELPGMRLNTKQEEQIIEVDSDGLQWLQKEVRKPATAKPRGRRVLTYVDTGTKTVQTTDSGAGKFTETFEVPGEGTGKQMQVKVTLPSYQVGIYRDRRYPFKIYIYNEKRGFDYFEVNDYFGGVEAVPPSCKKLYISNVLCYDMRSVIQTINAEFRRLQLTGGIK